MAPDPLHVTLADAIDELITEAHAQAHAVPATPLFLFGRLRRYETPGAVLAEASRFVGLLFQESGARIVFGRATDAEYDAVRALVDAPCTVANLPILRRRLDAFRAVVAPPLARAA